MTDLTPMIDSREKTDSQDPTPHANSAKKLLITISIAGVAAILIGVLEILPAQYGIDLTGFGTYVGLTKIYEEKVNLREFRNTTTKEEDMLIEVPAGEDLEYKLYLLKGDRIKYSWTVHGNPAADGSPPETEAQAAQGTSKGNASEIFFEFHGEPENKIGVYFERYRMGSSHREDDSFVAPFDGTHGWYWRNDHASLVTITLEVQGKFNIVGLKAAAFSR